jgi:hypothetical protein
MTFAEALRQARTPVKARRLFMQANKMRDADWYAAWPVGLADEVAAAFRDAR